METGKHLRIRPMGDAVLGVTLEGNPAKPEPIYFRVIFPGGDVDVVRCDDGDYWIHVRVNHPNGGHSYGSHTPAKIIDARVDNLGKAASQTSAGDFDSEQTEHIAIRVHPDPA